MVRRGVGARVGEVNSGALYLGKKGRAWLLERPTLPRKHLLESVDVAAHGPLEGVKPVRWKSEFTVPKIEESGAGQRGLC